MLNIAARGRQAALIEQGQRDGSIRPDIDAAASAVILHGLLRGVAALLLTESEYTDMTSVRATVDGWIAGAQVAEIDYAAKFAILSEDVGWVQIPM